MARSKKQGARSKEHLHSSTWFRQRLQLTQPFDPPDATMHAEDAPFDDRSRAQPLECLVHHIVRSLSVAWSEPTDALIIEAHVPIDPWILVVTADEKDTRRVLTLEGEEHADCDTYSEQK